MTTGLAVRGLNVTYPGSTPRFAVRDATFSVPTNSSLALVGPSGSGKSSLLLAIAGVVPSTGALTWDGEDLRAVPTYRRGVGVVFQDGQLFPHLSVGDNVGFGLEMLGLRPRDRASRVQELLELVGLSGTEKRPVTELSGGERQRIALARTLAPRPRLVLLDEPLSSLDADLRVRLAVEVREVLVAAGATWIVVTHDRAEADVMASQLLTVVDGRVAKRHPRPSSAPLKAP